MADARRGRDGADERAASNWAAVSGLVAGIIGAFLALPFFPGGIVGSVIGIVLGDRGLRFSRGHGGRPGRILAIWALGLATAVFVLALAVALQAHSILSDPVLLRDTLEQMEAGA